MGITHNRNEVVYGKMNDDEGDDRDELRMNDPVLLFELFTSDIVAAEVDWENERFLFYPVNSLPDSMADER